MHDPQHYNVFCECRRHPVVTGFQRSEHRQQYSCGLWWKSKRYLIVNLSKRAHIRGSQLRSRLLQSAAYQASATVLVVNDIVCGLAVSARCCNITALHPKVAGCCILGNQRQLTRPYAKVVVSHCLCEVEFLCACSITCGNEKNSYSSRQIFFSPSTLKAIILPTSAKCSLPSCEIAAKWPGLPA